MVFVPATLTDINVALVRLLPDTPEYEKVAVPRVTDTTNHPPVVEKLAPDVTGKLAGVAQLVTLVPVVPENVDEPGGAKLVPSVTGKFAAVLHAVTLVPVVPAKVEEPDVEIIVPDVSWDIFTPSVLEEVKPGATFINLLLFIFKLAAGGVS
jgi:hypothetical protein